MGEQDFLKAMGTFYQKHKKTGATSEDFLKHVRARSKHNLDKLYDEWIYGTGSSQLVLDKVPVEDLIDRYRQQ